jgi:hypothetical protein
MGHRQRVCSHKYRRDDSLPRLFCTESQSRHKIGHNIDHAGRTRSEALRGYLEAPLDASSQVRARILSSCDHSQHYCWSSSVTEVLLHLSFLNLLTRFGLFSPPTMSHLSLFLSLSLPPALPLRLPFPRLCSQKLIHLTPLYHQIPVPRPSISLGSHLPPSSQSLPR